MKEDLNIFIISTWFCSSSYYETNFAVFIPPSADFSLLNNEFCLVLVLKSQNMHKLVIYRNNEVNSQFNREFLVFQKLLKVTYA